jgi:tripeptidyl-peptidase-2
MPLFIGPLAADTKLPKDAVPGRVMTGHMTLCQLKRGSGAAPFKVPLSLVVGPAAEAKAGDDKAAAVGGCAQPLCASTCSCRRVCLG